jgi:hypothetical protein
LSRAPQAAGALAERLIDLKDTSAIVETARALAPQASRIPPKLLGALAEEYTSIASSNGSKKPDPQAQALHDEKRRAILNVFRTAQSGDLVEAVAQKARRLRSSEPARAYHMLKEIAGLQGWNDEIKLEMALTGLQVGGKDLARAARSSDSSLHALQDIVSSARRPAKELAKVILKDEHLGRKAQHYVGFHFVERIAHEREFGKIILEALAEGRSEEGKLAKEKLILEGLIAIKPGKSGFLEERAKVMLAASDLLPVEKKKSKPAKSVKVAKPGKTAKAAKPAKKEKPKAKPAKKKK